MLRELGVYAAIVGHSERRQYFGETDESAGRRAAAALEAGLFVIACVGELESEREAGETEEVLRRQVAVLVRGRPARRRVRARVGDRHRQDGDAPTRRGRRTRFIKSMLDVPVLYGGSVKPEQRRGAARARRAWTARSSAAPRSTSTRSRRFASWRLPARSARHPRRVGVRAARARERGLARGYAGLRPALGPVSAHDARGLGRGGRPAGGSDGQLGGRAPDDRLGPRPLPGPAADQQLDRGRRVLRERRARRRVPPRARAGRTSTCSGSCRTAAFTRTSTTYGRCSSSRAARDGERTWIHAFTDGRDVSPHSAVDDLAELPQERIATVVRPVLRDGSRRAVGTDTESVRSRDSPQASSPGGPNLSRKCAEATTPA